MPCAWLTPLARYVLYTARTERFAYRRKVYPPTNKAIWFTLSSAGSARAGTWGRHNNGLANELSSTYQGTSWIPPASRRRNAVVIRLKKRENPEDYPSAVACHVAANKECCLSYDDSDFRVLARCRSKHHLYILEAMYIHVLKPFLCKQKSFVANLTLFKHAHSTHSHKHTE